MDTKQGITIITTHVDVPFHPRPVIFWRSMLSSVPIGILQDMLLNMSDQPSIEDQTNCKLIELAATMGLM